MPARNCWTCHHATFCDGAPDDCKITATAINSDLAQQIGRWALAIRSRYAAQDQVPRHTMQCPGWRRGWRAGR